MPTIDAFFFFRCLVGVVLIGAPHLLGNGFDADGISDTVAGVLILVVALASGRHPSTRWWMVGIGIWVAVFPFLVDARDLLLYLDVVLGKTVALSALVPPDMFEETAA